MRRARHDLRIPWLDSRSDCLVRTGTGTRARLEGNSHGDRTPPEKHGDIEVMKMGWRSTLIGIAGAVVFCGVVLWVRSRNEQEGSSPPVIATPSDEVTQSSGCPFQFIDVARSLG